jgi:short-subunit dehydrogenase
VQVFEKEMQMESLVLITGATGGVGKAMAMECASRGWDLFLTDLRKDRLEMLASGLERSYGVRVLYEAADLTNPASRAVLFERICSQDLRFRGLINVAGTDHEGLFLERSAEQIVAILRLNIEATLIMTHALLAHRDEAVTFRIVNVSSLAAFFSMPVKATYAASKRFILDFSLALRNELRDQNVTVTALCPAGLPTTDTCIAAIESQGIMGQLTTEDIGKVAHQTIEAALHDKAVVIPGFLNRVIRWLGGMVPPTTVADFVGSRWRMAQQKREVA